MAQGSQDVVLNVAGDTRQLERDIQRIASSNLVLNTKGFSQPLGKITGQLGEFEKSLAASNARVIAFGVSAGAIYAVEKAFGAMVQSTISVQKSLAEINTILNTSTANLNKFGNDLFELAKNTGQSFDTVAKSALEFSRQGLGVSETLKRTNDALILTRLSGLDVVSSTESITAALNSFNQTVIGSNELINKLIAVDNSFAVSSADLAEAIKRVGSSAQDAGVGLDELVALVTSAQQITARGGAVIGNSFKTIFTRLQRPEVLNALDELGVKTRDAEGNIAPLIQILGELSTKFEGLSGTQKSQTAELVGGVFQINILKAALSDLSKEYSVFNQALSTSEGATDEANKRNEELNTTLSAGLNKTFANLTKAASDIGGLSLGPALKKSLGGLNGVLETFAFSGNNADGIGAKIGEGIAKGIGNFLGGPGIVLATLGIYKIFERLTKFSADAFKTLSGMNTASNEQAQIQSQVINIMSKNPALVQQIAKGNVDVAAVHREILSLIEQETISMQKQLALAGTLAKSLGAAGVGIGKAGPLQNLIVSNKALEKNKSFGYIPNFNDVGHASEIIGASLGGYKAGKVKRKNLKNEGEVIYNDAESIVKYPGFEQEAILPPRNSKAGDLYKNNFKRIHGFDPYANEGFIPNFADYNIGGRRFSASQIPSAIKSKTISAEDAAQAGYMSDKDKKALAAQQASNVISSSKPLLALRKQGSSKGYEFRPKGKPPIDVQFPIVGFNQNSIGFNLESLRENLDATINDSITTFASSIYKTRKISPPVDLPQAIGDARRQSEGLTGALEGTIGGIFESAFRAAFGKSVKASSTGAFDINSIPKDLPLFFPGSPVGVAGDFKNSDSSDNRKSMALKILKAERPDLLKFINQKNAFGGFIPNFAALEDAVNREKKAEPSAKPKVLWSDTLGSLVVANTKQTAKYGPNADKIIQNDHINQGQNASKSNLMKSGSGKEIYKSNFIPNFALNSNAEERDVTLRSGINKANFDMSEGFVLVKKQIGQFINIINGWIKNSSDSDISLKNISDNLKNARSKSDQLISNSSPLTSMGEKKSNVEPPYLKSKNILQKGFSDESLSTEMQTFKNKLVFASFGLSMVGGFASSFAGEDKQLSKSIDSATQSIGAATTAMGIIPGPIGLFAGAALGAVGAINSLAHFLNDKAPKLAEALDKAKNDVSTFGDSSQRYSATFQKAQDIGNNPKSRTEDIIKINKELNNAAKDIPSAYRMQLLAIQDNVELQEEINKIQKQLIQKQSSLSFATDLQSRLDDKGAVPQFLSDYYKGLSGGGQGVGSNIGRATNLIPSLVLGGADNLAGALGMTKVQGGIIKIQDGFYDMIDNVTEKLKGTVIRSDAQGKKDAVEILKGFSETGRGVFEKDFINPQKADELNRMNKNQFITSLEKNYGLNKTVSSTLRNSTDEDIKRLRAQIIELGRDSSETAKVQQSTEKARETAKKLIDEEKKAIDRAKSSVEAFKQSLDSLAKTAISFNNFQTRYQQQDVSNQRSLGLEKARANVDYMQPFLSPFEQAKLNYGMEKSSRNEDFINEAQGIKSNTNKSLMDQGLNYLDKLREKGVGEEKIRSATLDFAKINQNQPSEILKQSIMEAFDRNIGQEMSSGQKADLNSQFTSELNSQTQALLNLNQKTDQANRIAQAQLAAQKAIATRDVYRSTFGGQGAMSNYDLSSERNSALENVNANYNKPGFKTAQLANTYDLIGGFTPDELSSKYSGVNEFMEAMVDSRANDIRYQADTAIGSIRKGAFNRGNNRNIDSNLSSSEMNQIEFLKSRRSQAGTIAGIQVAEKLKIADANKNMGLNLQGLTTDVKGIYDLLKLISQDQQKDIVGSGIQQALQNAIQQLIDGFSSSLGSGKSNLDQSRIFADAREKAGEKTIKDINEKVNQEISRKSLEFKQSQVGSMSNQASKANPEAFGVINQVIQEAIKNNKSIPSLSEMQENFKNQNNPIGSRAVNGIAGLDTADVTYKAFDSWLNTVRDIQDLQQRLGQKTIELQQQNQQDVVPNISPIETKGIIPSTIDQTLSTDRPSPKGTNISPDQSRQLNMSVDGKLDRLANILQLLQRTNDQEGSGSEGIRNAIKNGYDSLKQSQGAGDGSSEETKNLNGKVDVSPVSIDGQVKVSLEGSGLSIKIDETDLEKTKATLENAMEEKLSEIKTDIFAKIKDFVDEAIKNNTNSNATPYKFRSNDQYNLG